jgi:hypothetical protein
MFESKLGLLRSGVNRLNLREQAADAGQRALRGDTLGQFRLVFCASSQCAINVKPRSDLQDA